MMRITLNGENREVTEGQSVSSLLSDLGIPAERVAVELNLKIVDRQAFTGTSLCDGDRLEVIGFIGGGKNDDDER
jgi:thiamine biosynthesis protein ThiS